MSEFISIATKLDGDPQRIAVVVQVVLDYFDGHDIATLKQRLLDDLGTITSIEMAYAVQTIADSEQAIGNETFTEGHELLMHSLLDEVMVVGSEESTPAGHPVHTFIRENRAIAALVAEMRRRIGEVETMGDLDWWNETMDRLWEVDIHYTRKENQLFPFLEKAGFDRPSKVMWSVHDEIRSAIKTQRQRVLDRDPLDEVAAEIGDVLDAVEDMISKEEMVLYPTSLRLLSETDWVEIRRGEAEVGYCLVDAPVLWEPEGQARKAPAVPTPQVTEGGTPPRPLDPRQNSADNRIGTVGFDGGALTPEELNLLLKSIPLDITYVDEFDEVRFYNRGTERVFPRSPGIIGREVRYCHPPKSVHIVLEIVSSFKEGNRDTAEFWIQMGDSFIHIRYFAVRDGGGNYRGVIEVSQDVTHLRRAESHERGAP